ncbi:MAG: EF-P lysine aminoacylase GenX [Myxococcales bacterium]|nr:EF-P lysine aminoacylase GenX [Myxococcales bacterium]|tara:strand:+ start:5827 stop:6786 length:960 start_codon:yes stop_codon:yes gene_type:complete
MEQISPDALIRTAQFVRWIRAFFDGQDYTEIFVPLLVPSPGMEPHIDAYPVQQNGVTRYLQTSPEYALKTLLGRGMKRIYAVTPCFRDEPASNTHSPQFTMLEWYRVSADLFDMMDETEALIHWIIENQGGSPERFGCDLSQPFERIKLRDAFIRYTGVDPWLAEDGPTLRKRARDQGWRLSDLDDDWDNIFCELFVNEIEPKLGRDKPCLLYGWPRSQAALARLDPNNATEAMRFELYAGGFELANAFDELTDPVEQKNRFIDEQKQRRRLNRPIYDIDLRLLAALEHVPPCAGIALGIERLSMLLIESRQIEDVLSW